MPPPSEAPADEGPSAGPTGLPPIPAAHAAWAHALFRPYLNGLIRRRFHGWGWAAADPEALQAEGPPLLFLPNHSSWWDGFVAYRLCEALGQRLHVMMQRDQLAKHRFFARLGAFGVDLGDRAAAQRDLAYAGSLLGPGQSVWIFPQGKLLPPQAPLRTKPGAARLAIAQAPVRVVPVALRFQWGAKALPEAYAWLGAPRLVRPGEWEEGPLREALEADLAQALAALDARIAEGGRAAFQRLAGRWP